MTSIATASQPGASAASSAAADALVPAAASASPGLVRPVDDPSAASDPGLAASLLSTTVSLVFVLLLAYAVLRLVKRFQSGKRGAGPSVHDTPQVLRTVALGARERLVVVRYKERDYLLGVTPGAVTRLDADPAAPAQAKPSD